MRIGLVIGLLLAVLIIVGCGSSAGPKEGKAVSPTAHPQATIQAAVAATLAAQPDKAVSPTAQPQAAIEAAVAATLAAQPGKAAASPKTKDSSSKRDSSSELILNFPRELNFTLADLSVGWEITGSGAIGTLTAERGDFSAGPGATLTAERGDVFFVRIDRLGKPESKIGSSVTVYPGIEAASARYYETFQIISQSAAISNVTIADEGFMYAKASGIIVEFRKSNVLALVSVSDERGQDASFEGAQEWAKRLESIIEANASSVSPVIHAADVNLTANDLAKGFEILEKDLNSDESFPRGWVVAMKESARSSQCCSLRSVVYMVAEEHIGSFSKTFPVPGLVEVREIWESPLVQRDIGLGDESALVLAFAPREGSGWAILYFKKGNAFVEIQLADESLEGQENLDAEVRRLAKIVEGRIEASKYYMPSSGS